MLLHNRPRTPEKEERNRRGNKKKEEGITATINKALRDIRKETLENTEEILANDKSMRMIKEDIRLTGRYQMFIQENANVKVARRSA